MKKILISRITPCCLLDYSNMVFWIDNLNDIPLNTRQLIKDYLLPTGQLKAEGWILIANSAKYEIGAPINAQDIINWANNQSLMTCNQLKVIINALQVNGNFVPMEYPPLDLIEMDLTTRPLQDDPSDDQKNIYMSSGNGSSAVGCIMRVHLPYFHFKNIDYIINSKPYLVIERFTKAKRKSGRIMGWKRAPSMEIGQTYHNGWNGADQNVPITPVDMYRPNNIPIEEEWMSIDIRAENYIQNSRGNKIIPKFVGDKSNAFDFGTSMRQRVPIRFRVGINVNGTEYLSKPLLTVNIVANVTSKVELGSYEISVGYGKP